MAVRSLAEQVDGWLIDLLVLQLGVMFCLDLVLFLWIPMAIHMIPDEVTTRRHYFCPTLDVWGWASALQPHTYTLTHSHTLSHTLHHACGHDEIKGTQDLKISC